MTGTETLPLFPLQTVLVPGGALGLRIFETRYLDLIRDCGRSGTGFGVCLILDGDEAGAPAVPAAVGTEARIEDFGTTGDGLLMLRVRGARRAALPCASYTGAQQWTDRGRCGMVRCRSRR